MALGALVVDVAHQRGWRRGPRPRAPASASESALTTLTLEPETSPRERRSSSSGQQTADAGELIELEALRPHLALGPGEQPAKVRPRTRAAAKR